jgi:hypothetical protein
MQMVEVAGRAIPILVALGRKRKNRSRAGILVWILPPRQLAGGRRRALRGEVTLMGVRSQVIEEEWDIWHYSHSGIKSSQKVKPCRIIILIVFLFIGMVWYKIFCLREKFHQMPFSFSFSKNGKMAFLREILLLNPIPEGHRPSSLGIEIIPLRCWILFVISADNRQIALKECSDQHKDKGERAGGPHSSVCAQKVKYH